MSEQSCFSFSDETDLSTARRNKGDAENELDFANTQLTTQLQLQYDIECFSVTDLPDYDGKVDDARCKVEEATCEVEKATREVDKFMIEEKNRTENYFALESAKAQKKEDKVRNHKLSFRERKGDNKADKLKNTDEWLDDDWSDNDWSY